MAKSSNTLIRHKDWISLPCVFESIGTVSLHLDKWLDKGDVPLLVRNDIHVCLDEIISNLVGYSQASKIQVECVMTDKEICITIIDDGIPFDPLAQSANAQETEIDFQVQIGGLGIMMVREMTREMLYQYQNGQNNLGLYFDIA